MGKLQYKIWLWMKMKKLQRKRRKDAKRTYKKWIATIPNPTEGQMDAIWRICHNEPGRD
jgi:hypothetical protein